MGPSKCCVHDLSTRIKRKQAECELLRDGQRVECVKDALRGHHSVSPALDCAGGDVDSDRCSSARVGSAGSDLRSAGSLAGWTITDAHVLRVIDELCARAAHCH